MYYITGVCLTNDISVKSNFNQICRSFNLQTTDPIIKKFCTHKDSTTLLVYASFRFGRTNMRKNTANLTFDQGFVDRAAPEPEMSSSTDRQPLKRLVVLSQISAGVAPLMYSKHIDKSDMHRIAPSNGNKPVKILSINTCSNNADQHNRGTYVLLALLREIWMGCAVKTKHIFDIYHTVMRHYSFTDNVMVIAWAYGKCIEVWRDKREPKSSI